MKQNEKEKKPISFAEAWKLNRRAMALWNQRAPKLLRAEGLSCLFQALSPLSAI